MTVVGYRCRINGVWLALRPKDVEVVVDDAERLRSRTLDELADARSALRYIAQRYGRLDGVGWDRVL